MRTAREVLLATAASLSLLICGPARAQLPDYDSLPNPTVCQPLYNAYVGAYNDYATYYAQLVALYPTGNNPPDTASLLQKKIDAMYGAQDAFSGAGCGHIDAWGKGALRGKKGKAPPPNKIKLKHKR